MKLKSRMKIITFIMVSAAVLLNTFIIILFVSRSLKQTALQSIQAVNQQTLITFDNLMDSFSTISQIPLMDGEIYAILNKDYSQFDETVLKAQKFKDLDTVSSKLYSEMFYKNQYIYSVTLMPFNSDLVYAKQRLGKGGNYQHASESRWFLELCETSGKQIVIFPQMKDDLYMGGEDIIAIGRLIRNPITEQNIGILRLDIRVKDLKTIWDDTNLPGESKLLVYNDNRETLYSTLDSAYDTEAMGSVKNGDTTAVIGGERYLMIESRSDVYGISIMTFIPREIIYQDAYKTIAAIVAVAAICLLATLLFTELSSRQMLKPIGELNHLMKEVRKGDLTVRSNVAAGGEFEEVCQSFNSMVEKTEELIKQIYREQEEKAEAEYTALKAQISPHFTLNTINAIKWMAYIQGNKSIENALESLGKILNFAVREKGELITIEVELKQMEYYINILSLRYYNRFSVEFDVDPEVLPCKTIKYMLQTIVENSVFHAFDENTKRGKINIHIRKEGNLIIYEIRDNGVGMSREMISELLVKEKDKDSGLNKIGIYNINKRIKLIFGEEYGITIESTEGEYTLVRIVIPVREG